MPLLHVFVLEDVVFSGVGFNTVITDLADSSLSPPLIFVGLSFP